MKVSALVKGHWMIFPFTMWFHFLLIPPHDGYRVWILTKQFSFFLFFLSSFLWKTLLFSETKLLTITGKKYFSTVLVVRTSAQDPNGLKKNTLLLLVEYCMFMSWNFSLFLLFFFIYQCTLHALSNDKGEKTQYHIFLLIKHCIVNFVHH